MERWLDTAAVLLFAGATGFVAIHSRGLIGSEEHEAATVDVEEPYAARVAAALPTLERHVASGSMRLRGAACEESEALVEIDAIETAIGPSDDPAISVPLEAGIAALRECVTCTPEPHGCADAARAFTIVEERLALPSVANGI